MAKTTLQANSRAVQPGASTRITLGSGKLYLPTFNWNITGNISYMRN